MIQYKAWLENKRTEHVGSYDIALDDTVTIFETNKSDDVTKSVFTNQINGRMFDGTYEFTLLPGHEAIDKIALGKSTIYITDNGVEKFRGRAVSARKDKYGRMTVTCENDLKFLVDVPDIFSRLTSKKDLYKYGNKDGEDDIGTGIHVTRRDIYDVVTDRTEGTPVSRGLYQHPTPYSRIYEESTDTEFVDGKTYYTRYILDVENPQTIGFTNSEIKANGYSLSGNAFLQRHRIYANHDLRSEEVGQTFEVRINELYPISGETTTYICQLKHIAVSKPAIGFINFSNAVRPGENYDVLYLGNIRLLYPDLPQEAADGDQIFDKGTNKATDVVGGVNWCIFQHFGSNKVLFDNDCTVFVCDVENNQHEPYVYAVVVKLKDSTTIDEMYNRIFCPFTTDESQLTGYNKFVPPERRIYAGKVEISAKLPLTEINTVYSNLQTWLQYADGYAKIRKVREKIEDINYEYYVLDLLKDSGVIDDRMTLELDGNVMDYTQSHDIKSIVTAIYPIGVRSNEAMPGTVQNVQEGEEEESVPKRYKLQGIVINNPDNPDEQECEMTYDGVTYTLDPLESFPVKEDLNLVYNKQAVDLYGWNIAYRTYELTDVQGESGRVQATYNEAKKELATLLTAQHSYNADCIDPRLSNSSQSAPVLGNYYLCALSVFDAQEYMPLTRITTDMIKPSGGKMTLGMAQKTLSDYTAAKKE